MPNTEGNLAIAERPAFESPVMPVLQGSILLVEDESFVREVQVVGELQGTLSIEQGAEVAVHLDRYYELLRADLLKAQITASSELLQRQIGFLLELRQAWLEVERGMLLVAHEILGKMEALQQDPGKDGSRWNG